MPLFNRLAGQRKLLLISLLGVGIPLASMLALQYYWLSDLRETTTLARQATLDSYLEFIDEKAEITYSGLAERLLVVPASELRKDRSEWRAYLEGHSESISLLGVKLIFMLGFREDDPWGGAVLWDPVNRREVEDGQGPLSVRFSTAYLQSVFRTGGGIEVPETLVDDRDPRNPVVLRPLRTAENQRLAGVIGIVIDPEFFSDRILPKLIVKVLPDYAQRNDLRIRVSDGQGRVVFFEGEIDPEETPQAQAHFSYLFRDWRMELFHNQWSEIRLARWSFFFKISLSVFLAAMLAAGTALILRTASREMHLSEMKNDFVSNVSHELKTPLASIRVFGEMMRHGRVHEPSKIQEYGTYIESESRRLSQLVKNILDFSKIESGGKVYQFESCDAQTILREVIETFQIRFQGQGFQIEFQESQQLPQAVLLDAGAIGQGLANLLENAVKYSGDSRRIQVGIDCNQSELCIWVKDWGIGIEAEHHKDVFDRFFRVSKGLVHEVRGSGLGLAIVRHIAEAHRGRVEVSSQPGQGSTFSMHLPLRVDLDDVPGSTPEIGNPQTLVERS